MSDIAHIDAILVLLRRSLRRRIRIETALWALGILSAIAGLSVGLAAAGWARVGLGLVLVSFPGALLAGWLRTYLATRNLDTLEVARLAERLAPNLGSSTSSAVDLHRQMALKLEHQHFSTHLAEAHIDHASEQLATIDLGALTLSSRQRQQRWAHGATAVGLALLALTSISLEGGRRRLSALLLDPNAAHISDIPLAGDIRITYNYPAYTGLKPRVVEGGDGSISAIMGTQVQIRAIADMPTAEATLKLRDRRSDTGETANRDILVAVGATADSAPTSLAAENRLLSATLSVLNDGEYRFALVDDDGDRHEERQAHAIRAVLDAYPQVHMDEPSADVELKDDQVVHVLWRAKDDFGVDEVALVVELTGAKEPIRIPLAGPEQADSRREGRYSWSVAELQLGGGSEVRFHVEAIDNDAISGPKKSASASRRLVVFSARDNHEKLLARQRETLDALVDWLAEELVAPFPKGANNAAFRKGITAQTRIVESMTKVAGSMLMLIADLRQDSISEPGVTTAFENVLAHVNTARDQRRMRISAAGKAQNRNRQSMASMMARVQQQAVELLEKDIIYLDDLLAIQRIDELKKTAQDLLAAQRDLQDLLDEYKQSQNPALKTVLEQRIQQLRQKMMELMARMASIKKQLPGEYRNMESAEMLQLDDQMQRLEKMLKDGDLEAAARELEQIANQLENMVDSINNAEEEFGGERYEETRQQLAEFAEEFRDLEQQQQALSERTEKLLQEYRKKSIERAGRDLDAFVEKVRKKAAGALEALEEVAESPNILAMQSDLSTAEQRLKDLDSLLEQRDFFEARQIARKAEAATQRLQRAMQRRQDRAGARPRPEYTEAASKSEEALEEAEAVRALLDQLFPDPSKVMSQKQMAQMDRMGQKQGDLQKQAQQLGQKMDAMAQQMPLFGGEPRANLESAGQEMGQAAGKIRQGGLPQAAGHEKRAVDHLGKLRQALEQASQRGGGKGLPLPLGGSGKRPGGRNGRGNHDREVEIPQSDPNRAGPKFRKDLLEASKQKPPAHFEDAVKRYYKELIR